MSEVRWLSAVGTTESQRKEPQQAAEGQGCPRLAHGLACWRRALPDKGVKGALVAGGCVDQVHQLLVHALRVAVHALGGRREGAGQGVAAVAVRMQAPQSYKTTLLRQPGDQWSMEGW